MQDPIPHQRSDVRLRARELAGRLRTALAAHRPAWRRARGTVLEIFRTLLIAFLLAQLIMVSVAQAFQVEQYSMEPTLLPHDRVLVSKILYRLHDPARGDVIVLRYPRNQERNYIKRVIGLSGETIQVKDGKVYVNGQPIHEMYLNGTIAGEYGPFKVPADSVFVMGDNRNNSEDSRSFGPLKKSLVVGRAVLVYWPPQRARLLFGRRPLIEALPPSPLPLWPAPVPVSPGARP